MSICSRRNVQFHDNEADILLDLSCSSLASAGNEVKLQGTGSSLEDLEEEFMDGRYVITISVLTYRQSEQGL